LGSGIKRALADWPDIDFLDDHDGSLFVATVHRRPTAELLLVAPASNMSQKLEAMSGKRRESVGKASGMILNECQANPSITIPELARQIGITERSVQRNIQKLQRDGFLQRVGGRKTGHWEVLP
jgi:ATP-dependent DNA helicase RecG